MKKFWKKSLPYVAIALVFSLLGAGLALSLGNINATSAQAEATQVSTKLEGTVTSPFTEAVKAVKDSVVGVNQYGTVAKNNYSYSDPFGFFGYGFPRSERDTQPETEEVKLGSGSGVAISDQGHILTNYHVVEGAEKLTVSIGDKEYDAVLVAEEREKDIAIIQAKDAKLNPVTLGDSDTLQVGEWAIAIGNPLTNLNESFMGTTTVGIISGLNRVITSDATDEYGRMYENTQSAMIQVDAAINSGNSGGGLFNVLGELVGIPSIKYSGKTSMTSAYIDGIGMCIPINDAKPLIEKVLSGEITAPPQEDKKEEDTAAITDSKPRLGVTVAPVKTTSDMYLNGKIPVGIVISNVEKDGPAEKAGLLVNDIIVEANGKRIVENADLTDIINTMNAGDTITLKVFRIPGNLSDYSSVEDVPEGAYADIPVVLEIIEAAISQ